MPELNFGDGSPDGVLNGTVNFLANGGRLSRLLQGSIFGLVLSVATGGINFIQSVINLIVSPVDAAAELVPAFFDAVVIEPLGVVSTGAQATAQGVAQQFGVFALPIAVALVLGTFLIINRYLREEETSDFIAIPGFPDIPDIGPFAIGVDEERGEDE